jgi:integrase
MGSNGAGKLTALFVTRHKKPGTYGDGGGLYLQIRSPTARSWIFKYWDGHRVREKGLGSSHIVSLQQARDLAYECRQLRRQGVDPIDAERATRAQRRLQAANTITFRECAARYIDAHKSAWGAVTLQQWRNTLAQHADPILGDLPAQEVDTTAVDGALRPIWNATPRMARRVRARIEAILDWAKVRGYRDGENPARWRGHLDKLLPASEMVKKTEHHAAMAYDLVPGFLADLRERDGLTEKALELLILTATRSNEVLNAEWAEIDLDKAIWTIPAERMKAGVEHRVPLSPPAVEILKSVLPQRSKFVFPGNSRNGTLTEKALHKLLVIRMKVEGATPHGFRSSFRDWAAERTSFPNHVVEQALAHTIGSAVERAYRRGDLLHKRSQLMNAWAKFCTTPAEVSDVIPLRRSK